VGTVLASGNKYDAEIVLLMSVAAFAEGAITRPDINKAAAALKANLFIFNSPCALKNWALKTKKEMELAQSNSTALKGKQRQATLLKLELYLELFCLPLARVCLAVARIRECEAVIQKQGLTYDRLFGYLNALGEKVCIEISEAKTRKDARLELEMTDLGEAASGIVVTSTCR
jgi:hypothetical protein